MTTPWSVLEIEPTDDTRAVKRAYARKLKRTRPDEDSVAFQQLHEAYKFACYLAENGLARQGGDEEEAPEEPGEERDALRTGQHDGIQPADNASHRAERAGEPREEEALDSGPPPDFQYLLDHTDRLLASEQEHHFVINWKLFEQNEHLLSEAFRISLGDAVFARVIAHWKACEEQRNRPAMLRAEVLHYLDSIFGWSNRYYDLLYGYDYSAEDLEFLNDLQNYVPARASNKFGLKGGAALHVEQKRKTGAALFQSEAESLPFIRGLAFFADIVILALITYPVDLYLSLSAQYGWPVTVFLPYLILAPLFEASPWSATPGKRVLGLQVLKKDHRRLSLAHAYFRALILGIMVVGVAFIDSLVPIKFSVIAVGIGVFSVYLHKSNGRCLNDAASFSLVALIRKT